MTTPNRSKEEDYNVEPKKCNKCQETKPAIMFNMRRSRSKIANQKFTLRSSCKTCESKYSKEKKKKIQNGDHVVKPMEGPPILRKDWDAFEAAGVQKCASCQETKPFGKFYKDNSLKSHKRYNVNCIQCVSVIQADDYAKNAEDKKERRRLYYIANLMAEREKARLRAAERRVRDPESVAKSKAKAYKKQCENPQFRMIKNARTMLWKVTAGKTKPDQTFKIIGCTKEEFIKYFDVMLADAGLKWEDYGKLNSKKGWEVDHKVPLNTFDFVANPGDIYKANHYSNLRPYLITLNRKEQYRDANGNTIRGYRYK